MASELMAVADSAAADSAVAALVGTFVAPDATASCNLR